MNRQKSAAWALVLTLAAAFLLPHLLLMDADTTHGWLYLPACALAFAAIWKMLCISEKRLLRYALGFGFAFTFFQLAGWRLDAADTLGGLWPAVMLLLCSIALAPAAGYGFVLIVRWADGVRLRDGEARQGAKVFWLSFGAILLCWLPVFLAYYPGMFNFDSTGEITQIVSGQFSANFPIVHTLLLGVFYRLGEALGSYNAGIAIYTILQCAAVAAAMAYAARYLYVLRCPRWMWIGMTAIFALLPMHSLMVMCTTKDLFFCAALLPLMIRLHMLWREPERAKRLDEWIIIGALTALMCFMRTNGVFSILAVAIVAVPFLKQHRALRRRLLAAMLAGLIVLGAVTSMLNRIYDPAPGGIREWLSVPLMQVARVYDEAVKDGRELPEKAEIEKFIPDVDRYQRHLADGVKRHATVGAVNLAQYMGLWGRLFMQYPSDIFDAAAYLTKGYWHLDDVTHLDIYAERGDHGYLETKNQDGLGVTRDSKLPGLMEKLDSLYVDNEYLNTPILSTIVEPAFWCWAACIVILLAGYRRDRGALLCGALLVGLFASMLFGPCAYIRYAYPIALCALPLLGMTLARE